MTHRTRTENRGQRSVSSKDKLETDGRTDTTDRITFPVKAVGNCEWTFQLQTSGTAESARLHNVSGIKATVTVPQLIHQCSSHKKQVSVEPRTCTSALNMMLAAVVVRQLLIGICRRRPSCSKPAARRCRYRSTRQTDGRTDEHPTATKALTAYYAVSVNDSGDIT